MSIHTYIHTYGRRVRMRFRLWKYGLKYVAKTCYICPRCGISKDLRAGNFCYIGPRCSIKPGVTIGDFTLLANNVQIIGCDHRFDIPGVPIIFSGRPEQLQTTIGKDCWIGANVIIMRGIKIGDGTIVAAGSVVTKSLDSYSIYAGVPARKIKDRFVGDERIKHEKMLNQGLVSSDFKFCERI